MTIHAGQQIHKHLISCDVCKFVHWHPLPDASTVARYYEEDQFYSQHSPPGWFAKEKWEHEQGYWQAYYDYLINFLRPYTPTIDIGAGAGWFVQRCPYALGVEPSATARKWSPVPDDMVTSLTELWGGKGNIVLMLTLEHILDPEAWLREEILPHLDGRLIVVVPNEWNPLQRWVLEHSCKVKPEAIGKLENTGVIFDYWFVSPVHLNYFTPDSLKNLLERVGLKVTFVGGTFPTELWLMIPGLDHRKDPNVGRRTHLWRLKLEKRFPWIFHVYGWMMRRWNVGREIVMVAEKR